MYAIPAPSPIPGREWPLRRVPRARRAGDRRGDAPRLRGARGEDGRHAGGEAAAAPQAPKARAHQQPHLHRMATVRN